MIDTIEKMIKSRTKVTASVWKEIHDHGGDYPEWTNAVNFYVYLDIFWIGEDEDGICKTDVGMSIERGTLKECENFLWHNFVEDEMKSKYNLKDISRLKRALIDADDSFWHSIAESYPEITTGDLSPSEHFQLSRSQEIAVKVWVEMNRTK